MQRKSLLYCNDCYYCTNKKRYLELHITSTHGPTETKGQSSSAVKKEISSPSKFKPDRKLLVKSQENDDTTKSTFYRYKRNQSVLLHCPKCKYTTTRQDHLSCHEETHLKSNEKRFKCKFDGCFYSATYRRFLDAHHAKKHSEKQKLERCSYCSYITASPSNLQSHAKFHAKKRLRCEYTDCEYRANWAKDLKAHKAKNHAETKYLKKCPHCRYATAYPNNLRSHLTTHEIKPYHCDFVKCKYSSALKKSLADHIAREHGETDVLMRCPYCEYFTVFIEELRRHVDVHLPVDKKFFNCDVANCGYVTKHKLFFKEHWTTKHAEPN